MIEGDSLFDDTLWSVYDDPRSDAIPVSFGLRKIGIEDMILFMENLVVRTKSGIVILRKEGDEDHFLYIPLRNPLKEHARILRNITFSLLNCIEFNYSIRERMDGKTNSPLEKSR